ncbi:hypothetical protein KUTeg_016877 [Tegillarca granosa]|uniref:Protein kinase domain-containing protein n=1 Tax=Tegillarca granosa TaxID=220873 RepID=A0ABQ9EQZ0_TEGGR|nr:hypothetical protein KUTeg_016877 [Tegillarca granosa]
MGFVERMRDGKLLLLFCIRILLFVFKESVACHPWSTKMSKMAQPDLNYVAPEVQISKTCSYLSDMFSLGMVICTIFNDGFPLIEADHSPSQYLKQIDQVSMDACIMSCKLIMFYYQGL